MSQWLAFRHLKGDCDDLPWAEEVVVFFGDVCFPQLESRLESESRFRYATSVTHLHQSADLRTPKPLPILGRKSTERSFVRLNKRSVHMNSDQAFCEFTQNPMQERQERCTLAVKRRRRETSEKVSCGCVYRGEVMTGASSWTTRVVF